jgi:hypothetical protein
MLQDETQNLIESMRKFGSRTSTASILIATTRANTAWTESAAK